MSRKKPLAINHNPDPKSENPSAYIQTSKCRKPLKIIAIVALTPNRKLLWGLPRGCGLEK